jgi:methylthioxylose transferase
LRAEPSGDLGTSMTALRSDHIDVVSTPSPRRLVPAVRGVGALLAAAVVIYLAVKYGRRYVGDPDVKLDAAPLVGEWDWRPSWWMVPAVAVALIIVGMGPSVMQRLRLRWAVLVAGIASGVFSAALAFTDGPHRVLEPVVHETEYWANLPTLPSARVTIELFSELDFMLGYSVHVKGHPPGFILLLQGLSAIGLGAPWIIAMVSYIGVAMTTVGVLITTRVVTSSDAVARRVAPFLVLIPFAVWTGTSADAYFSGVAALGVAAGASAIVASTTKRRVFLGALSGLLLGWLFMLTYGAVTFMVVPGLILLGVGGRSIRHRITASVAAFASLAVVALVFLALGFWWKNGLDLTRNLYKWGTAQFRPWRYFMLSNTACALIAMGPAVIAGLGSLGRRDRRWWIVGGGVLAMVAANVSQYSKGEVERIWLLFFPWVVPATAHLRGPRVWLALQATCAIVLQVWLVSKW